VSPKIFSKVMGSPPMQWAIRHRNFFVERLIPAGTATTLSPAVTEHYRRVQPSSEARVGWRGCPRRFWRLGRYWSGLQATCLPNWEQNLSCSYGA
jgi:hypothetical protein